MSPAADSLILRHEGFAVEVGDDGVARVRDVDLAKRLGYAEQLGHVEVIARGSRAPADFWSRMEREYAGGMLQLTIGGAS